MTVFLAKAMASRRRKGRAPSCPRPASEGVFLDPGLHRQGHGRLPQLLSEGRYASASDVLFLHTGGAPSLFTSAMEGLSMSDWQEALFSPRRVAIVGASSTPGKAGSLFLRNLTAVEAGFSGEVVAIHPSAERNPGLSSLS